MKNSLKKKVIAITVATAAIASGVIYESGANKELQTLSYSHFLNGYKIVEENDNYKVCDYSKISSKAKEFDSYAAAKEYMESEAMEDYENHKSFSEDFRKTYLVGVTAVSALASTCLVNAVAPENKKKRR